MKRYILLLLSTSFISLTVFAQEVKGITVVGKASIEKAPDQFSAVFTFEKRHALLDKAKANVDNKVKLLLQALKKIKIEDSTIKATSVQITPYYPQPDRNNRQVYVDQEVKSGSSLISTGSVKSQNKAREVLFDVRRMVEVKLDKIDLYEVLLDKAVKIGVTRISPVQSNIADSDKYYQQALSQAVENARTKAMRIANNLGVKLGKVLSLNEHAYRAPGKIMMASESMRADSSMRNYTGVNQISAEVTITFSLQE